MACPKNPQTIAIYRSLPNQKQIIGGKMVQIQIIEVPKDSTPQCHCAPRSLGNIDNCRTRQLRNIDHLLN